MRNEASAPHPLQGCQADVLQGDERRPVYRIASYREAALV